MIKKDKIYIIIFIVFFEILAWTLGIKLGITLPAMLFNTFIVPPIGLLFGLFVSRAL